MPSISISGELYRELGQYGNRDESWNDVVNRVLENIDEEEALDDKRNRRSLYTDDSDPGSSLTLEEAPLRQLENGTELRHEYQRGSHSGTEVMAVVEDGSIKYDGEVYSSPSPAALAADEDIRGSESAGALNGWEWWEFEDDGEWVPIDELRD